MHALEKHIATFFTDPTTDPHALEQPLSVLYLLRREIQDCLIGTVVPDDRVLLRKRRSRLFASAMVMFAGVDLLAKFASGGDDPRKAGPRFRDFLRTYGTVYPSDGTSRRQPTISEVQAIYRFRNALMHSFGLYSEVDGAPVHHFVFQRWPRGPVVEEHRDGWHLSIDDLFDMFCFAMSAYRRQLEGDHVLAAAFERMFPKYGTLFVMLPVRAPTRTRRSHR